MKLLDCLTESGKAEFINKGYKVPEYNLVSLRENTLAAPRWIHFGAGNIFRAFPATILQHILNAGKYDTGVIVCEGFDNEIIEKAYKPYDNLSLLTLLKADGTVDKEVVGSVTEALCLSDENSEDYEKLKKIFSAPTLQMVSFTITEKGYKNMSLMKKITSLLNDRFISGAFPIAMASMDNCSHNGDKLKEGVLEAARLLVEEKKASEEFLEYVGNPEKVSFPWSMIDKITPRPDEGVRKMLLDDGFEDAEVIITSKNTYTAPFVNAEETEYLVMEDDFPNGRPPLELGGVMFTDQETVDKVEKMKVCTCLNPLHTAMSIFGCILGFTSIHEEMKDDDIKNMITKMGYEEGMKVVVNPGIIKPEDFIDNVLTKRLPNPFMPDTPQRIACDTSQKIPIRFGETIYLYKERNLGVSDLKIIPLVIAGYLRYLMGVDDEGNVFSPSPDPMLEELMEIIKPVKLGSDLEDSELDMILRNILGKKEIFKVDLYECGLDKKIKEYFKAMIKDKGAVRSTLHNVIA